MIFDTYLDNIIKNLECENNFKKNIPYELNLCLEGGAFAGLYQYGVLLLLKKLEEKKYVKILNFSGSSVGSLLCLAYITNNLDLIFDYDIKLRKYWRENYNYDILKKTILNDFFNNKIKNISDISFCNLINNKLTIKYFDCNKSKYIIKQTYKSKLDVYYSLLKSTHIPFLANKERTFFYCKKYKNQNQASQNNKENKENQNNKYFLDGGMPYISNTFTSKNKNNNKSNNKNNKNNKNKNNTKNNNKTLILSISNLYFSKSIFSINNEENSSIRILEGILYGYYFFKYDKSNFLCNYYENMNIYQKIIFNIKSYFIYFICYVISKLYNYFNSYYEYDINFLFNDIIKFNNIIELNELTELDNIINSINKNNVIRKIIILLFIIIKLIRKINYIKLL